MLSHFFPTSRHWRELLARIAATRPGCWEWRVRQAGEDLLQAAKEGKAAEALALIELGADVNFRDTTLMTPLHWATN